MFYNFLFPQYFRGKGVSFLLLFVRLFFGALFFMHGLDKMTNFNALSESYPSVLGLGSYTTLMITVFCEFACSLFLMAVAFFDIHDGMMPEGELALIYMIVFIVLFMTGPGRYSVDYLIDKKVRKDDEELSTHK